MSEQQTEPITFHDLPGYTHENIFMRLIDIVKPKLRIKPLFEEYPMVIGSNIVFPNERRAKAFALTRTDEGSATLIDVSNQENITITPYKICFSLPTCKEALKDKLTPVVESHLQELGEQIVTRIDGECYRILRLFRGRSGTTIQSLDKKGSIRVDFNNITPYFILKRPLMAYAKSEKGDIVLIASVRYGLLVISKNEYSLPSLRRPKRSEWLDVVGK